MISTESCQQAEMGKAMLPTFSHNHLNNHNFTIIISIIIIENLRQKFLKPL